MNAPVPQGLYGRNSKTLYLNPAGRQEIGYRFNLPASTGGVTVDPENTRELISQLRAASANPYACPLQLPVSLRARPTGITRPATMTRR
jgi:hypothetical protein